MTLEMMSERVISDWPKTDVKSQGKKKPPQKWCWPSRVRVKEKGNAWPTWNSHYNISMFSRARTFLQESSSKPRPLSQSWPPPALIPGRPAPWAHLAIMHTQCIMCSMTEVRNRWPTHLLYLACMVFRNMDLLLTFKNQELSLKNADFWFLRKAERCDNCWVCIPMQRQLARGEKELPPSVGPPVPGYQQLCCLSSTHSGHLPGPHLWALRETQRKTRRLSCKLPKMMPGTQNQRLMNCAGNKHLTSPKEPTYIV